MHRNAKLLAGVDRSHKILEIGPSYNPTITRSEGWNVYSLDYASAADLRERYRRFPNVDLSRIEEVDFVWTEGTFESAIPPEHLGTFDAVIASHVIEHQPNLVGFFQSISRILKPGGLLNLAVPDKRFCFDYFMPVTFIGDVLEAASLGSTRHTKKAQYYCLAYQSFVNGQMTWMQGPMGELSLTPVKIRDAKKEFDAHRTDPDAPYVDLHAWYFTPAHFKLILLELGHLGLIHFSEAAYFPPAGCEFIISLRNAIDQRMEETVLAARRLDLLKQGLLEIREQTDFLLEGAKAQPGQADHHAPRVVSLEMEVRMQLEERLDEMTRELATQKEQWARELAAEKETNQQLHAATKRWNHRPWYSRALHKLRDAALRPPEPKTIR